MGELKELSKTFNLQSNEEALLPGLKRLENNEKADELARKCAQTTNIGLKLAFSVNKSVASTTLRRRVKTKTLNRRREASRGR